MKAAVSVTAMLQAVEPPTAVFALHKRSGRAAIRSMLATGAVVDLSVFDDVADPDLLVIPPLTVVAFEPRRLGAAAAAMTLERLDGLASPVRNVVLPPLFQHPRAAAARHSGADMSATQPSRRRRPTLRAQPGQESR